MVTFLARERLQDFAIYPTNPRTFNLNVAPGVLLVNNGLSYPGRSDTANFSSIASSPVPITIGPLVLPAFPDERVDLIAVDNTLAFHIIQGTPAPVAALPPVFPANLIPLALVTLLHSDIDISSARIQDVRSFLSARQDRTRKIRIDALLPGAVAPSNGTSGNFSTIIFNTGIASDVKFSFTIPEDFDYNRELILKLRGFTGIAGGVGNIKWRTIIKNITYDGTPGVFPAPVGSTVDVILPALDNTSYEIFQLPIMGPSAYAHFALRGLTVGDLISVNLIRRGGDIQDTYIGNVAIIEVTLDYNVGYSNYPG